MSHQRLARISCCHFGDEPPVYRDRFSSMCQELDFRRVFPCEQLDRCPSNCKKGTFSRMCVCAPALSFADSDVVWLDKKTTDLCSIALPIRRVTGRMNQQKRFSYPSDLAQFVRGRLSEMRARAPALSALDEILETAFFASMKTEEAEQVLCTLTYVDIQNPDPSPPEHVVADRWSYVRFEQPIPLNVKNLVKVSKSIDNAFATLAIYKDSNERLVIWGAIDQQGQRAAFAAREADEGPESPGLLQVSISGVGAVEVYKGYTLLGALRQGRLACGFSDVLEQAGPIQAIFQVAMKNLICRVQTEVGSEVFQMRDHWPASISGYWLQALARILLRVQRYRHGGAILLTPDNHSTGLSIKYPIRYERLSEALKRFSVHAIKLCGTEDEIHQSFLDTREEVMPVILHLDQAVFSNEQDDTREEVTGCIGFIASLSRVDGLILMNRDLDVRGYGGIIKVKEEPPSVWLAGDPAASVEKLQEINAGHFGTRHQSMMRICFRRPESVGFVVSQDGDVRAMTRVDNRLIVWEDVKLRLM